MAALGLDPPLGVPAEPASALSVVRELGAVQAQDYASGAWSLGVRSGLTVAQVEEAVARREIVRTWPMRGTIHWVAAADARWMCKLLATARVAGLSARYRQLGITDADVERAGELFAEHLREPMSRPDAVALLVDRGIDPTDQRAYHLVGHHCMTGLLCQGPLLGRQPSFVLIDAWVPHSLDPPRDEAMATVVERYVRSHGPVTEKDVAGCLMQPLRPVREALAHLGSRITHEAVAGQTWLTHVDARQPTGGPAGVHLLPQWDEFLLGYKSRGVTLPDEHLARVVPGRNMVFKPTLVVDGEVAGVWKRRTLARDVVIEVEPFEPLDESLWARVEQAGAAYGRHLGRRAEVRAVSGASAGSAVGGG